MLFNAVSRGEEHLVPIINFRLQFIQGDNLIMSICYPKPW